MSVNLDLQNSHGHYGEPVQSGRERVERDCSESTGDQAGNQRTSERLIYTRVAMQVDSTGGQW